MPPDRHPEPGVQVGEGSLTLGSSDARRSRSSGDVPSPCSVSIGSRKYKARQHRRPLHCRRLAIALQADRTVPWRRSGQVAGACPRSSQMGITPVRVGGGCTSVAMAHPTGRELQQLSVLPEGWSSRLSKLCRRNVSSSVGATAGWVLRLAQVARLPGLRRHHGRPLQKPGSTPPIQQCARVHAPCLHRGFGSWPCPPFHGVQQT